MDLQVLLDTYKNGRRVRRRRYNGVVNTAEGVIYGTSLGGATKRGGNRPMLNVNVKWDDGTETSCTSYGLDVLDAT